MRIGRQRSTPQQGHGHVVDVGARGAGHDEPAHLLKRVVGIVILEHVVDDDILGEKLRGGVAVVGSGQAGPEAIISKGSPRMSERTMLKTWAGAQCMAKRPPFTAESRLRMVFISTMSAPEASS